MPSRIIFFLTCSLIAAAFFFFAGMYSGANKNLLYRTVYKIKRDFKTVMDDRENLLGTTPTNWIVPKRYSGNAVTTNTVGDGAEDLVFLQGFFDGGLELRLLKRDGGLVAKWRVSYQALADDVTHIRNRPSTDWNVGFHGAVVNPDGSVVFNLSYIGLIKLNSCGERVWLVDRPTHHSVERNVDGSFWVPVGKGVDTVSGDYPRIFKPPYTVDALLNVSANGEIIQEVSLLDVFLENQELGLLTLTGSGAPGVTMETNRPDYNREIFHLNDVEAMPQGFAAVFPMFAPGDLLVSIRNRNMVLVVDPRSLMIKWWHIGPWIRQHDSDWNDNGTITVFNNNRDRTESGEILGGSQIISVEPTTKKATILAGVPEGQFFYSEIRGKHQLMPDGSLLIVEAEAGRVLQIDPAGKMVWEFVNEYDEGHNARITNARVYAQDYFTIDNWDCSAK